MCDYNNDHDECVSLRSSIGHLLSHFSNLYIRTTLGYYGELILNLLGQFFIPTSPPQPPIENHVGILLLVPELSKYIKLMTLTFYQLLKIIR